MHSGPRRFFCRRNLDRLLVFNKHVCFCNDDRLYDFSIDVNFLVSFTHDTMAVPRSTPGRASAAALTNLRTSFKPLEVSLLSYLPSLSSLSGLVTEIIGTRVQ